MMVMKRIVIIVVVMTKVTRDNGGVTASSELVNSAFCERLRLYILTSDC